MGYELEYKRGIFKIPKGENRIEDNYFWIIQEGSNNCFELNGKRARNWYFMGYGWKYQIIQEVCKRAGYTEGGSITLNGRNTTPENYLKLYRKQIKQSEPIENLFKLGFKAIITIKKDLREYEKELLKEIKTDKDFYENDEFEIELNSMDNLKKFLKYICLSRTGVNYITLIR